MINPGSFLRKAWAFQKRNIQDSSSYRFAYLFEGFEILSSLVIFFFIAKFFSQSANPYLAPYGGDYFSFVLLGIACAGFQEASLHGFSFGLNNEQSTGTLEAILMTPTRLSTIMFSGYFWNFLFVLIRFLFYLAAGVFLFHAKISGGGILTVFVLFLSMTAMAGFGIISAGFMLIHKRGDPISALFSSASKFLAGVYFPVTILPSWIQGIAQLFPLTHTLSALRKSMLANTGVADVWPECLILAIFSAVLIPAGIFYFRHAVKKAKREGSLTFV